MSVARGILKLVALIGGAFVTFISLLALAGVFTDSGWARAAIAIVVAIGVPLFLVERILARLQPDKMKGVTTDVLAITYAGFSLAFVGIAHGTSRPILQDEGVRLERAGMPRIVKAAYLLAGGSPGAAPAVAVTTPTAAEKPTTTTAEKPATTTAEKPAATAAEKPKAAEAKPSEPKAGDGKERTPAQIFKEFAPSVVTITIKGAMGEGGGTGFLLDAAGTIGTNYHVIENASELKVKLMDGTVADEVEVLAENEPLDLALLRIKTSKPLVPVVLGDSDKVTVGERAVSIGNPLGLEHTLTDGLISARRVMEGKKMIQMSTPVSPGNSGGPLFNLRGEVIGVSSAIYLGNSWGRSSLAQNLNLAMPINDLRAMISSEYPSRHKPGEQSAKGGRW